MLDADNGFPNRAWAEYISLLDENPRDMLARKNRALLALRFGRFQQAEADLTILLRDVPERADVILARRAVARLALGRLEAAEADAAGAYRRKPTPSRERLWVRTLLALHRAEDLCWLSQPDDLTLLPGGGPSLQADLRSDRRTAPGTVWPRRAWPRTVTGSPRPGRIPQCPERSRRPPGSHSSDRAVSRVG